MFSSRPARTRTKAAYSSSPSSEEEHTDAEDTPRPNNKKTQSTKSSKKRRTTDAVVPLNDISTSSLNTPANESRIPLRTVSLNEMNDDLAEKRRRRKSNKIMAQPSLEDVDTAVLAPAGNEDTDTMPASSQQTRNGANALRTRPSLGNVIPLNSVEEAPPVRVPLDVMSSNFEEWMKLATDNVCTPIFGK